jgi:hypothetical protein
VVRTIRRAYLSFLTKGPPIRHTISVIPYDTVTRIYMSLCYYIHNLITTYALHIIMACPFPLVDRHHVLLCPYHYHPVIRDESYVFTFNIRHYHEG